MAVPGVDRYTDPAITIVWGSSIRIATMDGFDPILNWKLKEGSHRFPGKDGGTCINEAALVAAGFEYRPMRRVENMPECFSRPICHLATQLNDSARDAERQRLLPFVARLACADTPEIERERASYIEAHTPMFFSFEEGIQALEGALAIGRQADPLGLDAVNVRFEAAKGQATRTTSVPDTHLFFKAKGWFESVSEAIG